MFDSISVDRLRSAPMPGTAAGLVDELRALEEIKCAAEARQARLAAELDRQREKGAHAEIALARRVSPHRGRQLLSLARILPELPHTRAAFDAGLISEWRATLIARETATVSREHRELIDEAVARDAVELSQRGDRQIVGQVAALAARLDPAAVAARRRRAEAERTVTVRPAPDTMVYLTALLPVAQGVGVYAALRAHANTAVGTGAATSLGQAMADELVRRVTGQGDTVPPVALRLTMPMATLLDAGAETAFLEHYGPLPPSVARALVADNLDSGTQVWVKRLFTRPETGELISMESRARLFPAALAEFLDLRDQFCRTPYCGAPIRHHDHIEDHARGGPTSGPNGQGLCADCNPTKSAPGWRSEREGPPGAGPHTVVTTTPTGHRYRSRAPAAT